MTEQVQNFLCSFMLGTNSECFAKLCLFMPEKNPFAVPEPYYLPGYTGHCPKYNYSIGQTYGHATHAVMEALPHTHNGGRLKPLPENIPQWLQQQEQEPLQPEDLDILKDRKSEGYIPHAKQMIGLNFNRSCVRGVAEFERMRKRLRDMLDTSEEAQ